MAYNEKLAERVRALLPSVRVAEKKMMGKEYMGIARTSFLIDPKGMIAKVYESVKPPVHAEEVLKDLKILRDKNETKSNN